MVYNFNFVVASWLAALTVTAFVQAQAGQTVTVQEAVIDMGGVEATFTFAPLTNSSVGATVTIVSRKLPSVVPEAGFEYHIHVKPVGPNNDCGATGGHLDPTNVGMVIKCDPETPEKCQEGDLSGKHGNLSPETLAISQDVLTYVDNQLQFSGEDTTIVGRSIVVHSNGARIACANLVTSSCHEDAHQNVDSKIKTTASKSPQAEEDEDEDEDEGEGEEEEGSILLRTNLGARLTLRGPRLRRYLR